jgi:hypothetical protein
MNMNIVMSYPGIIVEMMEDYYESGKDFEEIKYDHARYFIEKNYYLYRDLVSKDLAFYEKAFNLMTTRGDYKDKILTNER